MQQLTPAAIAELEKQQYRIIGSHSAVKTCGWTKNMIKGQGGCYKLKFYGIMSNQCMQMTTSISCANRCTFCWRGYKAPVGKEWKWDVDEPETIFTQSVEAHHKLLVGFKGSPTANKAAYQKSRDVRHVALSLTGEPITYPKMNELLNRFNQEHISTFMVTNATYPDAIKNLQPVTQLYISLDAPEQELLKKVDLPLFPDYWERLNQSLVYLSRKKQRTCIRLTMIKDVNMQMHQQYAQMIMKGTPDFLEVKSYMHVGSSRENLQRENMPLHEEVVEFCQELVKFLPDYEIVSEHIPSRVVLFAHRKYKVNGIWHTWIDFEKWHQLVNSGEEFTSQDYWKRTPQTGLSGKGTKDHFKEVEKRSVQVDEKTPELSFY
ncbi:4-demethylwyosine synthase TYW1 [Candidatus Woesearchaeota archaeon]|nr:4-demethylwyosine synthase TYW1 [Candidatus Woesearchaeota archaeon]